MRKLSMARLRSGIEFYANKAGSDFQIGMNAWSKAFERREFVRGKSGARCVRELTSKHDSIRAMDCKQ
jgi:hypothetical protein